MAIDKLVPGKGYLIGGGIASLAAAVFMIRDGRMQGKQIHIFEESDVLGGALDGRGNATDGYQIRGGHMFDYEQCQTLFNLLSEVPSVANPQISVTEEIYTFNEQVHTYGRARLIDKNVQILDVSTMGFSESDRLSLVRLLAEPESFLGNTRIDQVFSIHFFTSNFWYMWATMFAFQPWHSAVEFRRYMKLFMHEFPRINTLTGIKYSSYNQYESIVLPLINWLKFKGVVFEMGCRVTDLNFLQELAEEQIVSGIIYLQHGREQVLRVHVEDLVIVTNGSMGAYASVGSMTAAPAPYSITDLSPVALWKRIASQRPEFGKPDVFFGHTDHTVWESFTITCGKENTFLAQLKAITTNDPGTGGMITLKDSSWLLSIVVVYQPHFINQPEGVTVCWGYGLFPNKEGDYVNKKMSECTGAELLTELLCHLQLQKYIPVMQETSICIPCMMPFVSSQFMPRHASDRPVIRPKGYYNLAFASQYTEMPEGVVFTIEYSVKCAMIAVYDMLGLDKSKIPPYYHGDEHISVLFESLKSMNK